MSSPRHTFKVIVWVPVKRLFCDSAMLSTDHMALLARTTGIYHDNLAGLAGF